MEQGGVVRGPGDGRERRCGREAEGKWSPGRCSAVELQSALWSTILQHSSVDTAASFLLLMVPTNSSFSVMGSHTVWATASGSPTKHSVHEVPPCSAQSLSPAQDHVVLGVQMSWDHLLLGRTRNKGKDSLSVCLSLSLSSRVCVCVCVCPCLS